MRPYGPGSLGYPRAEELDVERFSMDRYTFVPRLGKRPGNGPFDYAPIVQGAADLSGVPDVLSFARGDLLGNAVGHFYEQFDPYQGTILKWYTPELASAALAAGSAYLWYISADYYGRYDYANSRFEYCCGGVTVTRATAIVAGTTYLVSCSWDCNNSLDGTNFIRNGLDDSYAYGGTGLAASSPAAIAYIGSTGAASPANAILEGIFYFRRVLWDGSYGTPPLDGTDELAAIYAAGAGEDPSLIVGGSWDTTFCLPTNCATGLLATGTGEAWSHPHDAETIDVPFMSDGDPPGTSYAVEFDGSATVIDCGSDAGLDDVGSGGDMTVDLWFRADSDGENDSGSLFNKWASLGNGGYYAQLNATDDHLYVLVECDTTDAVAIVDASAVGLSTFVDGKWHLLTVHYEDTANKRISVAVDGKWASAYDTRTDGAGNYTTDAAHNFRIGVQDQATTDAWDGGIAWCEVSDNDRHTAGTDFISPRTGGYNDGNTVADWPMDEGTGVTVDNAEGTAARDGTITSGSWSRVWEQDGTPVIMPCLELDNAATKINGGSGATIDNLPSGANGFTAEGWWCLQTNDGYDRLWDKSDATGGWNLYIDTSNLAARVRCATTDSVVYVAFSPDNRWHHIAITYDDGGARQVSLWVDGILRGTGNVGVGIFGVDAALNFMLGAAPASTNYLGGLVGWQRLSDTVRYTADFVPAGRSNPPAVDGNTMLQWDMTQGAGTTATDTSGNANNGTITMGSGRWWNSTDMENVAPGERTYPWGYVIGSDGASDGLTILEDVTVTAGDDYVVRAPLSIGMSGRAEPFLRIYDNTGAANIVDFLFPVMSGIHTGANNQPTLTCGTARWVQNLVGWELYNITDASSTTITAQTETTLTGVLAGGTDNDWDTNDEFLIRPPGYAAYADYPWAETFVFTAPAGCASIDVKVLNAAGEGAMHVHQVEVLGSELANGDMETGAGNPWLVTGFSNFGLAAGESVQELAIVHAGSSSLKFDTPADVNDGQYSPNLAFTLRKYYSWGLWMYESAGSMRSFWEGYNTRPHNTIADTILDASGASWRHYGMAVRKNAAGNDFMHFRALTVNTTVGYFDDAYVIALNDVSLTATPASEANSLEEGGIRVDGDDRLEWQFETLQEHGIVEWRAIPRFSAAVRASMGAGGWIDIPIDGQNYLYFRWLDTGDIRCSYEANNVLAITNTWTPTWAAGDDVLFRLEYGSFGVRVYVDNRLRLVAEGAPTFTAPPTLMFTGRYWGLLAPCDMVIKEP